MGKISVLISNPKTKMDKGRTTAKEISRVKILNPARVLNKARVPNPVKAYSQDNPVNRLNLVNLLNLDKLKVVIKVGNGQHNKTNHPIK